MRSLTYYVASTIDGFIGGPDGKSEFFPWSADMMEYLNEGMPETVPTAFRAPAGLADAANRRFDTVLMGAGTYRMGLEDGIISPWRHLRQYVFSGSITEIDEPGVTLVPSDPIGAVRRLKNEEGGLGIWLSGGGRLAGSLLPEIDELIIKLYPVVIGAGIPVFATKELKVGHFDLTGTRMFSNGAAVLTYTKK
ncbi:dihydrofolate reductase family protein [Actinomadura rudentiformis]|uniref:Dihydrofolate reductase n=1 Tax=Actinomadura rudentiformis TaxID=359158 RepID=A0A6H9Z111_9ACTN|nr:dihydrofolate reductase family protein [Actinomadura rudentiformis]KAB2348308.1 dihydrofolate reductase [Actinomadura rudentiformis]